MTIHGPIHDELDQWVATLSIPAERKAVVLAELLDHAACAAEAAAREGRDPEVAAREAVGNLESLRRSLEAIEPAFGVTRWRATLHGLVAGALIALLIDFQGSTLACVLEAVAALGVAALCAPPRALELLRAELRAPRVRASVGLAGAGGVPIGPAVTYAFTVMYASVLVWIGQIVYITLENRSFDTPPNAFVVMAAVWLLLLVEGVRARLEARRGRAVA
jgi:hypothetical protein